MTEVAERAFFQDYLPKRVLIPSAVCRIGAEVFSGSDIEWARPLESVECVDRQAFA